MRSEAKRFDARAVEGRNAGKMRPQLLKFDARFRVQVSALDREKGDERENEMIAILILFSTEAYRFSYIAGM